MSNMKTWNVFCEGQRIGTVEEVDEDSAGSEALSKYGLDSEEWAALTMEQQAAARGQFIPPGAGISVTPA